MNFFIITYHKAPGDIQVVESTLSGFCLFSKWESRAKLFTDEEASELLRHLKAVKYNDRNKFFKLKYELPNNNSNRTIPEAQGK